MVCENKQQISEFIDGEALSDEMLIELASNEQLKDDFEHYQLIGDILRDELPPALNLSFAAKVAAVIELEPTVLVPRTAKNTVVISEKKPAKVIPLFSRLGQYGIAASIAAARVIGVQQLNIEDSANKQPQVLQTYPMGGFISPVSLQTNASLESKQRAEQKQRLQQRRQVNAYLQDHILQQRLKSQMISTTEQKQ